MSGVEGPRVGIEDAISALHYQSVISLRPLSKQPSLPSRLTMKLPTSLYVETYYNGHKIICPSHP
jgi:hypothetical protein